MYTCEADDDTNHDYHLWSSIIEFKDTTHQEIMSEICFATVFVKIYTIKIDILFVCHAKLCYTPDILSYIFHDISMINIQMSSQFFMGLGTSSLDIFWGAYSTAELQIGSELEACQMLHS